MFGMSSNIGVLLPRKRVSLKYLSGRVVAVDALNALYQFLSIIRLPTGMPLRDHLGRITSHLSGLLYRTISLLEANILPIYVFDGKPPRFKHRELVERRRIKERFTKEWIQALIEGDLVKAFKKSVMTAHLTSSMIEEAKHLLSLMGIPWVQAPSEGEAQAAYMAIKGDVWATASQDYDSLLFGTPRLVRNLTISGRRKLPKKREYIEISPEVIYLDKVLKKLKITREQLIDIAILIGTDYNPDGVKGVGPKTALKLIRFHGSLKKALKEIREAHFPVDPDEIKKIFLEPRVTSNYKLSWNEPDRDKIVKVLCDEHDFSLDRVQRAVDRALKAYEELVKQVSLERWFKFNY